MLRRDMKTLNKEDREKLIKYINYVRASENYTNLAMQFTACLYLELLKEDICTEEVLDDMEKFFSSLEIREKIYGKQIV